jgi:3-hydroxyacyl-CoA dehydrogenase
MDLDTRLQNVAVVGAAGKMGQGISLLLAQEMASLEARLRGKVGSYRLHLIDSQENGLVDLRHYLKQHLKKFAEKKIISLRADFKSNPALISNEQIVNAFVEGAMDMLCFETHLENVQQAQLIFEAISENEIAKVNLLRTLKDKNQVDGYVLTNTSSIPIAFLAEKSGLGERLIGFHFYNPPAVQKLVEVIATAKTAPPLLTVASELIQRLKKSAVSAKDIAGFIGNGHFIREMHYACSQVQAWSYTMELEEAIFLMDSLTQKMLLRPMGIFQLIDYVGIDICDQISKIMAEHFNEPLQSTLLQQMLSAGITGGQYSDGSQKKGFFGYEGNVKKEIYSLKEHQYRPISELEGSYQTKIPPSSLSWKSLQNDPQKTAKIHQHFQEVFAQDSWGAKNAQVYLQHSREIAQLLVTQGVAHSLADVDKVLELGFFHLYGVSQLP